MTFAKELFMLEWANLIFIFSAIDKNMREWGIAMRKMHSCGNEIFNGSRKKMKEDDDDDGSEL
jgi:hypothetical protein